MNMNAPATHVAMRTQEEKAKDTAHGRARSIIGYVDPQALLDPDKDPESLALIVSVLMQFYHQGAVDALDTLKARMR